MIIEAVISDFRIAVVAYRDAQPNKCRRFTAATSL